MDKFEEKMDKFEDPRSSLLSSSIDTEKTKTIYPLYISYTGAGGIMS